MTREYVVVQGCPNFTETHQHLKDGEREYCHAVGQYLSESDAITYKELKEKWKGEKKEAA